MPRSTNKLKLNAAKIPESGLLIGDRMVAEVFGLSAQVPALWRRKYGFPGSRLPGGEYAVTMFAINDWLRSREAPPIERARLMIRRLSPEDRARLLTELSADHAA